MPICYKLNLLYNNATQETNYWFPIYGLLSRVTNTSELESIEKDLVPFTWKLSGDDGVVVNRIVP